MSNPFQPGATGPTRTPRAPDVRPLYKRKRVWAGGLALLALGGIAGGGEDAATVKTASEPRPTVTATEMVTASPKPAPTVTKTAKPKPRPTVTVTVTETVTETVEAEDSGYDYDDSGDSGSSSVYYENCAAARAAGAAPVRRGEPGYGSHLDRDGDGTGCDWG
ncbi:excalibur calcium-binding domain-containing protein [Streptomyces sp. NPDC126497]|uniref:excalibur calcium-binding domain-containing protein n=1 Tax=Streptomyces sp. NPDC126497 TaxID=3155313 RepID=UPI00332FFD37